MDPRAPEATPAEYEAAMRGSPTNAGSDVAGDWIKMRMGLRTHPKVVRMSSALNADRFRVIGALHAVWSLADEHTEDGKLPGYSLSALDDSIGWTGFAKAMQDVEWVEVEEKGLSLPRFDEHNGASAKRRAMEAERKRRARNPSAPDADKKRTREEKRRSKPPVVPLGFERFWKAWPPHDRKQAKGKCCEVWATLECEPIADTIVSHVEALKASEGWRNGFIPAPLVHLNQRRWEGAEAVPPAEARMVM
jgi:hypothetical protein